jgi:hypothetical protein
MCKNIRSLAVAGACALVLAACAKPPITVVLEPQRGGVPEAIALKVQGALQQASSRHGVLIVDRDTSVHRLLRPARYLCMASVLATMGDQAMVSVRIVDVETSAIVVAMSRRVPRSANVEALSSFGADVWEQLKRAARGRRQAATQ